MNRKQRREIERGIEKKRKKGLLPPQVCPACLLSLQDPSVPEEYQFARDMFSLVEIVTDTERRKWWRCPYCQTLIGRADGADAPA